jgi:UTP-glucose-1-phosphate uridylyltransferase
MNSLKNINLKNDIMIILPACGTASRIGNIPKFLLPLKNNKTLLKNIIEIIKNYNLSNVWISTRPEYGELVYNYTKDFNINIKLSITNTMSETIKEYEQIKQNNTIMFMPDTYIKDQEIIQKLMAELEKSEIDVVLGVWKIEKYQYGKLGQCLLDENDMVLEVIDKDKTCQYEYAWGVIGWKNKFWNFIEPITSHIGYALNPAISNGLKIKAIKMNGKYFDCGTIEEYILACNDN